MGSVERRRVACKECRLQKVRCDAEPPRGVCSRCQKLDLTCSIEVNKNKRKTKSQLQKELESLKGARTIEMTTVEEARGTGDHTMAGNIPSSGPDAFNSMHPGSGADLMAPATFQPTPSKSPSSFTGGDNSAPRSLDGHVIDGRKIKDCFDSFFRHYQPLMPVVNSILPDECFQQSPFLFWVIVYVGGRRYARDPTLLGLLSTRINPMALQSLESRATPIQTIQGLLVLCIWPVPVNTMHKSITSVLSGAAVHLAMQIGLHVVGSGQDFARNKLEHGDEQRTMRAQLWEFCVMISFNISLAEGLPPLMGAYAMSVAASDRDVLSEFPENIRSRRKIHGIIASCIAAIQGQLQEGSSKGYPGPLGAFISLFDAQFAEAISQCTEPMGTLYAWSYRLHALSFYFLEHPTSLNSAGLVHLYAVACRFMEVIVEEDERSQIIEYCPEFIQRAVMLAGFTIIKMIRSSLSEHIDIERGEAAYFAAILFDRRATVQNDDLSARAVTIKTQLWTSNGIFRRSNGEVHSLETRIRSRLSMSIVFDCFWWWKEEFAGQTSPYAEEAVSTPQRGVDGHVEGDAVRLDPVGVGMAYEPQDNNDGLLFFADDAFPDFDWAANFDFSALDGR